FKLVVKFSGSEVESFDNLTIANVIDKVSSAYVTVAKVGATPNAPKTGSSVILAGGNNGTASITAVDYEGDAMAMNGLHAFDMVDDINIVLMPDSVKIGAGARDAIIKGYSYCQNRKDCFFIADPPFGQSPTTVKNYKEAQGDWSGQNAFNSSFAALYYPWVYMSDPLSQSGGKIAVPPSGAIAGTYAHTDSVRGVHKAPAGISDGYLDSVSGIERIITKSEHDTLNPTGIDVIRSFPSSGIVVWGARTLSADAEWKYINIRRLFLFLEESIDKGTQWVVFEPNSPALWGSVIRNITAFLLRVWRDGALFGSTPEEAFYVKVDAENNPPEVRDAGQLIVEVGVAPVKPAEFVIIRIQQKTLSK
ncbi:MAG: phage tail sheath subtilisin-like domain-containing protein, partial [Candidatus Methanoperedens sp.]|nr:phage tail sheath subtilisin-like domain-containing protein [Candidatus Methanoperedens sp.]